MAPRTRQSPPLLGTTLVVGGCGFLGYHLVRHLLQDEECSAVYAMDRDVQNDNKHDGAVYVRGDITDGGTIHALIAKIQPTAIFHIASPHASLPASRNIEFEQTNVKGTQILLTAAAESDSVQAFIFTSSVDIYANPPHEDVDETHPLWSPTDKSNEYNRTKSIADCLVREANGPKLRTVTLRPGHAYGERHVQGLVEVLDMCCDGQKLIQVGKGENLMEVVSADNVAIAHLLAAKALLDPSRAAGKVDGEGFNVSDGAPVLFWHHIKMIWKEARGEDALANITVLPAWVMAVAVILVEWALWIFTLDTVKPPTTLRRVSLDYCTQTHTYSIEKARERLLFKPEADHDAILAQSARWMLNHRKL
ncbi:Fc.00g044770.m01.CDS01 [Cosmosporella sp. VM-42]